MKLNAMECVLVQNITIPFPLPIIHYCDISVTNRINKRFSTLQRGREAVYLQRYRGVPIPFTVLIHVVFISKAKHDKYFLGHAIERNRKKKVLITLGSYLY